MIIICLFFVFFCRGTLWLRTLSKEIIEREKIEEMEYAHKNSQSSKTWERKHKIINKQSKHLTARCRSRFQLTSCQWVTISPDGRMRIGCVQKPLLTSHSEALFAHFNPSWLHVTNQTVSYDLNFDASTALRFHLNVRWLKSILLLLLDYFRIMIKSNLINVDGCVIVSRSIFNLS